MGCGRGGGRWRKVGEGLRETKGVGGARNSVQSKLTMPDVAQFFFFFLKKNYYGFPFQSGNAGIEKWVSVAMEIGVGWGLQEQQLEQG